MMKHTLEKTGFVQVQGGQIHFRYYEPHTPENSAKNPILFLHGGPGASHAIMYDCLAELADGRPAIFYDQLGSYYSPAELTTEQMTVERYAEEITCLLQHLGHKKAILCGHSWGGALAAYYTINNPERVSGLILSCPLLSTETWIDDCNKLLAELPEDIQETIKTCEADGTTDSPAYKQADDLFSSRHFLRSNENFHIFHKHKHKAANSIYFSMWGPSEFSCNGLLKNFDVFPKLSEINVPTLLLCGEYDTATPKTLGEAQKLIRKSSLEVIPDSGHLAFLDNNEAYLSAIKNFLLTNNF